MMGVFCDRPEEVKKRMLVERIRVLLIEDNPADTRLIQEMLAEAKNGACDLECAERLSAGLERLAAERVDVVLLDLGLPDSQGLGTVQHVRDRAPDVPIVVLTGLDDEALAVQAVKEGAQDYLVKGELRGNPLIRAVRYAIERKHAEKALRESESKYRTLVENLPQRIFVKDLHSIYVTCNDNYARDLSIRREDISGKTDYDFFPEKLADKYRADDKRIMETGETTELDEKYAQDGKEIWVHTVKTPVKDEVGNVTGVLGIFWDITERRRMEEERAKLEKQLLQSQKMEAVGQLAGGIAHDFNNLLMVINGYSSFVLNALDSGNPARRDVEEIRKAGERAATLTRQLLAFSRRQVLQPKILNLNTVVAEMDRMLRRVIGEDIELVTVIEPNLGSVRADPGQIEQVIVNLAINARDAMPGGGKLTIETTNVDLDADYVKRHIPVTPGSYVMLAVTDTGIGMEEETQSHIFEPFFTTKERGKGTGLGLATVYGIVKQSDGYIWVYSEAGHGTTFKIYFPQVEQAPQSIRDTVHDDSLQGCETILVVEDEQAVRELVRRILEGKGYTVLAASNGEEALLFCNQHKGSIHLLITDVVMPGVGGHELTGRLANLRPEMKVLYMSGYTDNAIVRHGLVRPGAAFLSKPITPDALIRKVRDVLRGRLTEVMP
jgi:PAS domain S-box-containing protein